MLLEVIDVFGKCDFASHVKSFDKTKRATLKIFMSNMNRPKKKFKKQYIIVCLTHLSLLQQKCLRDKNYQQTLYSVNTVVE